MLREFRSSVVLLLCFTVLTGVAYPLLVTGISQLTFPHQANGSIIRHDGVQIGSELIGQSFGGSGYFWGRPSATPTVPYNAKASAGSNLGPSNPALFAAVGVQLEKLRPADSSHGLKVPVDLVTTSGSGLDPHISTQAALYQVGRIARERGLHKAKLVDLIAKHTRPRDLLILGEPAVNVLQLNLALDSVSATTQGSN